MHTRPTPRCIAPCAALVATFAITIVLGGCNTGRASQPGAIMETTKINWGLSADISVDMTKKLSGSARKSRLLFFTLDAPNRYVEGVFVSSEGGLLNWLFGGAYDDMKAAAAYNAVYGKADVLVNPQWSIEVEDYLFFAVTKCSVTGYAGTIRSFSNQSDATSRRMQPNVSAAAPRTQAFATPLPPTTSPGMSPPEEPSRATLASIPTPPADTATATDRTLQVRDLVGGSGAAAVDGDSVSYHYTCSVLNGESIFDSRQQGLPRRRIAGSSETPAGLGEGLLGARAGMHRQITVPPSLAYGADGLPSANVPPNATLVLDLYVDQVTPAKR